MARPRKDPEPLPRTVLKQFHWMIPEKERKENAWRLDRLITAQVARGAALRASYEALAKPCLDRPIAKRKGATLNGLMPWDQDRQRWLRDLADLNKRLRNLLGPVRDPDHADHRLLHLLLPFSTNPDHAIAEQDDRNMAEQEGCVIPAMENLMRAVNESPVLQTPLHARRKGHQPEPWIKNAEEALREAGWNATGIDEMLRLVRIKPDKPHK